LPGDFLAREACRLRRGNDDGNSRLVNPRLINPRLINPRLINPRLINPRLKPKG
jgi:hypothetical protein